MADTAAPAAAAAVSTPSSSATPSIPETTVNGGKTKVFYSKGAEPVLPPSGVSRQERLQSLRTTAPTPPTPAAESAKTEAPKADGAPKPESKAEEKPNFSAIARAEKRIREQAKAHQQAVAEFETQRSTFQARTAKAEELEKLASSDDPYTALEALARLTGKKFDVNEWARRQLRQGQPAGGDEALARVEKLEKMQQEREAAAKVEAERANVTRVRTKVIEEVDQFVQADGSKYELIGARKAAPAVYELIAAHYRETGLLLTYAQACDAVEAHLEEDAASYLGVDKVKKKFGAPSAPASQEAPSSDQRSTKSSSPERKPNSTTTPDRVPATRAERRAQFVAILSAPPNKR